MYMNMYVFGADRCIYMYIIVTAPHQRVLWLPHSPEYLHIFWAVLAGELYDSLHTAEDLALPPEHKQTLHMYMYCRAYA